MSTPKFWPFVSVGNTDDRLTTCNMIHTIGASQTGAHTSRKPAFTQAEMNIPLKGIRICQFLDIITQFNL